MNTVLLFHHINTKGGDYPPKVGDLIFFNWHDGDDPFDHVGIVELVNGNGTVTTIEGNWNNKVTRVTRKLNSQVIGFGRPP